MGFRIFRIRLDRGARRGKSFVESARGLQRARFGDPGHPRPRSSRGRGAECRFGLGVAGLRQIEHAEAHLGDDEIWLQRDRRVIARHRPALLAHTVEDVGEIVVRAREAGVEAESGGERLNRLFQKPCGRHRDAEVMV